MVFLRFNVLNFFIISSIFIFQNTIAAQSSHLGLNKIDLSLGYLGHLRGATGQKEYRDITTRLAQKAMVTSH